MRSGGSCEHSLKILMMRKCQGMIYVLLLKVVTKVSRYGRIISRISQRSIRQQETVKRVLGWIGCSPVPLTIYELEQAILVSTEPDADAPTVDSSLNIVKLCGPIVEVVDERPQFVHSTVKEQVTDLTSTQGNAVNT